MKLIFNIAGVLMMVLGVVGIALPVLPTTPFFLLALWFFGRGSDRLRHWLLHNKVFGSYIRNYRNGRGVPLRVRVWTLVFLWATIDISVWHVNPIWLKIGLLAVAVAVTVHILMLGRRKVVVLVPTDGEAAGIPDAVICGVGMAETAAKLMKVLKRRPRMVILAGIAGAYPDSGLEIGDCIVVSSERIGGLPPAYDKLYECPQSEATRLPKVAGITVQHVGGSLSGMPAQYRTTVRNNDRHTKPETSADRDTTVYPTIENMEGAVFFAMCEAAGVKFLEIRAVSNMTTDRREEWRVEDAVKALAVGVKCIFDEFEA